MCLHQCTFVDTLARMNHFETTAEFDRWLSKLTDNVGKARITQRVQSAMAGHFGDCAPAGEGVSEMRVHVGPGYRVYFTRIGAVVYLLLAGGDKASQSRDIKRAIAMVRALKE